MPQLPTYTAQLNRLPTVNVEHAVRPDTSDSFRTIAKAGETLLSGIEEKESREAVIASSEIRAKYARELDEAAVSGADTSKIKEKMQEDHAKVAENFQTKRGQSANEFYAFNNDLMFDEQANKIRVTRAAADAQLAGSRFLSSAGSILQQNPTYLGTALDDAEALVSTYQLSPEKKALALDTLRKELNMSAAISAARLDPQGTRKRLEAGEWELTPEQRQTAVNKADTEFRAARAEMAYLEAQAEKEARQRDDVARDRHFAGIMDGTATRRAIMDDADLRPQTREHMIALLEHRAKELASQEKVSNPVVKRDLWLRIHAPDGDPRKIFNGDAIFEQVKRGNISVTDANQLNTLVAAQKDDNNRTIGQRLGVMSATVARALSQDPRFIGQPALVADIQNDYNFRVQEKIDLLRRENKDPNIIFDARSKEFVGSREFVQTSIDGARQRQTEAAAAKIQTVNSQAEYDALPEGTPYRDSNGNPGVKRGKQKTIPAGKTIPTEPSAGYDAPMMAP